MTVTRIGIAGWNIPQAINREFPSDGTHLARYGRVFNCVEINSSFYREHRPDTYRTWGQAVPEGFQFSLKLLRYFTHESRLKERGVYLRKILSGPANLGEKWRLLLIQLPPKLEFNESIAGKFFGEVRRNYKGLIFCEPRNISWSQPAAKALLGNFQVDRVVADPAS